jgi:tRNA dimethylallyltransferase
VLRAGLEAELARGGVEPLFARLQALDPATARAIDRRNPRRVLRALEIVLITGRPKVELEGAAPPPYRILQIGLTRERAALHRRIDRRVEEMVEQGLVEETRRLLEAGYDPRLPALSSLGYREIGAYLRGEMTLPQAVERIQIETHRFVRHQETWFRKLEGVAWFDLDRTGEGEIAARVAAFLG